MSAANLPHPLSESLSRRDLLKLGAAALAGTAGLNWLNPGQAAAGTKRPQVAAIYTQCFYLSHAYHILHPFLGPYLFNGKLLEPQCDVISFYGDQFTDRDLSRGIAKQFDIPIYKTIPEALCNGGDELAVDAVLSIGEHGGLSRYEVWADQVSPQAVLRCDRQGHGTVRPLCAGLQ